MSNISELKRSKCTGCLVCVEVCPLKCIEEESDTLGFIYPSIDRTKCIDCGVCAKNCPEIMKVPKKLPREIKAARRINEMELKGSSSGGVATVLAKHVVEKGGIYYGAVSSKNGQVVYRRIDDVHSVNETKGSKYVQSDMRIVYDKIQEDLQHGQVFFVGTPCQCAAIENFCERNRENLYIASFPCGGWTSTGVLQSEIREHIGNVTCDKVVTRDRHKVFIDIYRDGNKVFSCKPNDSYFMTALDYKLSVRESCWNCTYCCEERVGDIVLGDFWGYEPTDVFNEKEIKDGISFVGCLSEKATKLLNEVLECMKTECAIYDNVIKGNPRLSRKIIEEKHFSVSKRDIFEKEYKRSGLKRAVLKADTTNHIVRKLRGVVKYRIMRKEE